MQLIWNERKDHRGTRNLKRRLASIALCTVRRAATVTARCRWKIQKWPRRVGAVCLPAASRSPRGLVRAALCARGGARGVRRGVVTPRSVPLCHPQQPHLGGRGLVGAGQRGKDVSAANAPATPSDAPTPSHRPGIAAWRPRRPQPDRRGSPPLARNIEFVCCCVGGVPAGGAEQ